MQPHTLRILSPWETFTIGPSEPAETWNGRDWRLRSPLAFALDGIVRVIPSGFVSDGKSIPFWYRWRFRQLGEGIRGAVIHDWIYRTPSVCISRTVADWIFAEAQRLDCVGHHEIGVQWIAVRTGGWFSYRKRVV